MSIEFALAAIVQVFFIVAFLTVIVPFRMPMKKIVPIIIIVLIIMCTAVGIISICSSRSFLLDYGHFLFSLPLFIIFYFFSKAKGTRFIFVVATTLIFHHIIRTLLLVIHVYLDGYTIIYFAANFLLFSLMIYGAWHLRLDFHKIIFTYHKEFNFLSIILILLFLLIWLFSPIVDWDTIDTDILLIASLLYLLTTLLYLFIGFSFHSFSKRLDIERDALSLSHQMQAAQDHIELMKDSQDKALIYRHDLRHHLLLISEFLESGNLKELGLYLKQTRQDIESITPKQYCANEAASLLLESFFMQAKKVDVKLIIESQIPQALSISNTELCALISNALVNAITATADVHDGRKRGIQFHAHVLDSKLLISVENPYSGTIVMENGLPQSKNEGHGFGTKSIEAIAEKYGGLSFFEAQNGIFTLRVVI